MMPNSVLLEEQWEAAEENSDWIQMQGPKEMERFSMILCRLFRQQAHIDQSECLLRH